MFSLDRGTCVVTLRDSAVALMCSYIAAVFLQLAFPRFLGRHVRPARFDYPVVLGYFAGRISRPHVAGRLLAVGIVVSACLLFVLSLHLLLRSSLVTWKMRNALIRLDGRARQTV